MRELQTLKFREVRSLDPWLHDESNPEEKYTLLCCREKIVDQGEKQDFVPFITIKVSKSDRTKYSPGFEKCQPRQVMFNVLSVIAGEVVCSVPCSVPDSALPDLGALNIKLSKSSCMQQNLTRKDT